jgi:DNA-binding NtrC family response regulator
MRCPQLLVYEADRRLATLLQPLADKNNWLLREPRQLSACLRLLDRRGPGVLLVRLSRDAERELAMLEQIAWRHPDTALVLVIDGEQAGLAGLAWDLGVRWLLTPPHTRERLTEIVAALMRQFQMEMAPAGGGT